MADQGEHVQMEPQSNAGKWILLIFAIVVVGAFGYSTYLTHTSIQHLNQDLSASQAQVKELQNRMQTAEGQEETLARQAGMTKKELTQRTAQLLAEQKAAAARLEKQQQESIQAVSGDIAGVRTDVGGVKTDVASTKADLEATKAKLQGAVGDLHFLDRRLLRGVERRNRRRRRGGGRRRTENLAARKADAGEQQP